MPGGRVKVVNSGSICTQVYQRPLVHLRADRPAIDDFHSASRHSRLSASIGSLGARQEPRKPNPPGFDDYTWEPRPDPLPRPSKLEHDGQQKVRRHRRPHERVEADEYAAMAGEA